MRLVIVAIRDHALDAFSRPVFVPSIGQAIRSFGDEVNNPASEVLKHPEDYDLYFLGYFDDELGVFEQDGSVPKQIAIGKDFVQHRIKETKS